MSDPNKPIIPDALELAGTQHDLDVATHQLQRLQEFIHEEFPNEADIGEEGLPCDPVGNAIAVMRWQKGRYETECRRTEMLRTQLDDVVHAFSNEQSRGLRARLSAAWRRFTT